MKQKSLLSIALGLAFSLGGLCSNAAAVIGGDVQIATIIAMIYVFPLFIDAIEELSTMYIATMIQFYILTTSIIVGIIYLLLILGYWALQIESLSIPIDENLLRYALAILPTIYTVSKIYDLRLALVQNENVAKAYCKKS